MLGTLQLLYRKVYQISDGVFRYTHTHAHNNCIDRRIGFLNPAYAFERPIT